MHVCMNLSKSLNACSLLRLSRSPELLNRRCRVHRKDQAFSEVLMDSECFFVVKVKKNSICIPCHTETLDSNPFKNFFLLYLQASFMLQCSLP
ncbi:unnamed protein product [Allacma fusca]|uniref:Uncharacterized protein n=1 Tax=Allacma fusca TaxID=39272 RepID=A0A8J2KCG6_9HEXA|nr:unnamed protein product [Allacma fusca]